MNKKIRQRFVVNKWVEEEKDFNFNKGNLKFIF